MNTQSEHAADVISLEQAKDAIKGQKENESLSRYFKALSFSELISETSELIEDLNKEGSTREIINKSKIILRELGLRITNSSGLSQNFLKMRDELEKRLNLF